jgi:hypothetical protein
MATAETIREAQRSRPFRPFRLRLIDGTEYEVAHPDWIAIPPARRAREVLLFFAGDNDDAEHERRWIDVGSISEITIPPTPQSAPRQGSDSNGAD